jgi:hypothetical protein
LKAQSGPPRSSSSKPYEAPDGVANLVKAFAMSLTDDGILSPSGDETVQQQCRYCGLSPSAAASARLRRSHADILPATPPVPNRADDS